MVGQATPVPVLKPLTLPGIDDYALRHTTRQPAELSTVMEKTRTTLEMPEMLCGPVVAGLLRTLVHAIRPRFVLEVGTFSGYSALAMAMDLPPDGQLVTCEIDPERATVARQHIASSPRAAQISLRVGPALPAIEALPGPFDLVFIDADKPSYQVYFESVLGKLSDRGLIVCDNTLLSGAVLDPPATNDGAVALDAFNQALVADPRVHCVLLTVRDGVTLIRRA